VRLNLAATDRIDLIQALGGGLLMIGLALAGFGAYLHTSIVARLQASTCDGCAPWHPLLVVTPPVVGTALVLGGTYLFRIR